jgi:hypothetical protein
MTKQREEDFDIKQFARDLLKAAIEDLKRFGQVPPTAYVVSRNEICCMTVDLEEREKREMYSRIVEFAREKNAETIVTVNDAFWVDRENYVPGRLRADGSEAICVTITGPSYPGWAIKANYERQRTRILVRPTVEGSALGVPLLGDWAMRSDV